VVNLLAAKAVQDGEISIAGGSQWRPLVHVKDVAKAIVGTLQAPRDSVCGQTFNVGCNKQNYQIAEIGRMVGKMVPGARVVFQPDGDNRNYRVSFDKIQKAIDFEPEYTVRDGIEEIVQAFRDGRIVDYRDPRYNNSVYLRQHAELLEDTGEAWPLNGHGGSPAHLPVPEAAKAGALPQPVASSPAA
jgi:dTDP-D-glucose 4,6-dehydratase